MKKILSILCVFSFLTFLTLSTANAVELTPGLQEFGISGTLNLDAPDDYDLALDVDYGYFIANNLEVGASVGARVTGSTTQFSVGPFAEYNIPITDQLFLALGLGVGLVYGDVDIDDFDIDMDDSALNIEGSTALKYFINDNVAITLGIALDWASSDVYTGDDEFKDIATNINIGTRFYF